MEYQVLSHRCLRLGLVIFRSGAGEMLLVLFLHRLRRHRCRVKSGLNSSVYRAQGSILLLWGRIKSLSRGALSTRASWLLTCFLSRVLLAKNLLGSLFYVVEDFSGYRVLVLFTTVLRNKAIIG